jgi:hypothetical protein
MIVNKRRKPDFQTWKRRGRNGATYLLYTRREKPRGIWNIPLEYGGRLAMTAPPLSETRPVALNRLSEEEQQQVIEAIAYIEENGDPIDNDESIFG